MIRWSWISLKCVLAPQYSHMNIRSGAPRTSGNLALYRDRSCEAASGLDGCQPSPLPEFYSPPYLPPLHPPPEAELLLCLFRALAVCVRQDVTALPVINVLS